MKQWKTNREKRSYSEKGKIVYFEEGDSEKREPNWPKRGR